MIVRFRKYFYQEELNPGDGGSTGAPAPSPAPSPSPAPAPEPAPAPPAPSPSPAPAPEPAPAPATKPGYWPDDWRTKAAGDDEKTAKLLERYNSPADVAKALREINVRISKGELKAPLKKDASADELKAWRAEQGIPETPDKYDLTLEGGLVIGDDDKPLVDRYVQALHEKNATPEQVKAGVRAYLEIADDVKRGRAELDATQSEEIEEALREEWGGDFKRNMGAITSMLSQADSSIAETIMNARGMDGRAIANNPAVVKWLASHARQLGYVGGTTPPPGGDNAKGIGDELKSIEATMYDEKGNRNPAYWKDAKAQERYRELLAAKERLK